MNCATHSDTAAVAFCRTCGKPLCQTCTRDVRGVIYCEECLAARLDGTVPAPGYTPPASAFVPRAGTVPPGYVPPGYVPPASEFVPPAFVPPSSGFAPPAQAVYPPGGTVPGRPPVSSGPNPAVAGILAGFFPFGVGAVYTGQYAKGLAHLVVMVLLILGVSSDLPWPMITMLGIGIGFFYLYQIIDAIRSAKAIQTGEPAPDPFGLGQTFGAGDTFDSAKVPAGAAILIGLGLLFLLHTAGLFEFGLDRFWPLILIALGVWLFARQWGLIGSSRRMCVCARCRTRKVMGPAILVTLGVLFLLDSAGRIGFHRTWPAILLVVGVVKLMQSNATSEGHTGPLPPGGPGIPPSVPPNFSPNFSPNSAPVTGTVTGTVESPASSSGSGEVKNG